MNKTHNIHLMVGLLLMSGLTACSLPGSSQATETPTAPPPPTLTPLPAPTEVQIRHQDVPGELPAVRNSNAGDHDSSQTADQKRAPGGDRFTFGRFERPFNADTMDVYFPYLDIQDTNFYQDDAWMYATIRLKDRDTSGQLPGRYAFEIDVDLDGRGDWLVLAAQPASTEWTTDGVQVWMDGDEDVGGAVTVNADDQLGGNGYESLLFDAGQGEDPDLAWVRVSPQDPNTVEMAAKRSILAGDESFMVGMWAGGDILNPALFDLNDHFTHEQAGAALIDFEYFYPIKAVSELDNACRMAVGFVPSGDEPGLCPVVPEKGEACPSQQFVCYNFGAQQVCFCVEP